MKFKSIFIPVAIILLVHASCAQVKIGDVLNAINASSLSNDEIIRGLKEALSVGTSKSTTSAAKKDGYYKNPKIKIPFPPEVQQMQSTLINLGMKKQVDNFVLSMNRAAEDAAVKAAPIFLEAVKKMTIKDGLNILKGKDDAATSFLKQNTYPNLEAAFRPVIKSSLAKVKVTGYWNPLATKYNMLPMVKKVNPNLENYVTEKALNGLFVLLAQEELKIRKDPAARITDLLKKVFGAK